MAEYPITEESEGDVILTIDGTRKRLIARREVPGQAQTPILLEGTLLPDGRLQVSCLKYRWPDGYEKWGPYLGGVYELEQA